MRPPVRLLLLTFPRCLAGVHLTGLQVRVRVQVRVQAKPNCPEGHVSSATELNLSPFSGQWDELTPDSTVPRVSPTSAVTRPRPPSHCQPDDGQEHERQSLCSSCLFQCHIAFRPPLHLLSSPRLNRTRMQTRPPGSSPFHCPVTHTAMPCHATPQHGDTPHPWITSNHPTLPLPTTIHSSFIYPDDCTSPLPPQLLYQQ